MEKCGKCKAKFDSSKEARDIILCNGKCNQYFHINCTSLQNENQLKIKNSKKIWSCEECGDTINKQLNEINTKVSELSAIKTIIEELQKSISFCSNKIDEYSKSHNDLLEKINNITKENAELTKENKEMKSRMKYMEGRINTIEQQTYKCNIEITGIPITANENCNEIVKEVAKAIGVDNTQRLSADRINKKTNSSGNILVQLTTEEEKNIWIEKFKAKKIVTAKDLHRNLPDTRVYINEHLTKENKKILYYAKQRARECEFKFTWVKNGNIFTRKSENSVIIKLVSVEDVYSKIG